MQKTKTYFEQIPLAIVRKIIEEQLRLAEMAGFTDLFNGELCLENLRQKTN
jgi:hypothetical protein